MVKQLGYPTRQQLLCFHSYADLMPYLTDKDGNDVWDMSANINSKGRKYIYNKEGLKPLIGYNVRMDRRQKRVYAYEAIATVVERMYVPIMTDVMLLRNPVNKVFLTHPTTSKMGQDGYNYILIPKGWNANKNFTSFTQRNLNVDEELVKKTLRVFGVCEATTAEREALADMYLATLMKFAFKVTKIRMRLRWQHHLFELGRVITWANWFLRGKRDIMGLYHPTSWSHYLNKSDHFNYDIADTTIIDPRIIRQVNNIKDVKE